MISSKKIIYGILVISLVICGIIIFFNFKKPQQTITNFEECVNAGYLVTENHPRACRVPDGRIFTEISSPTEPTVPEESPLESPAPQEDFCGWSTSGKCLADSDCDRGGCSRQVCQSKDEESIITTCEWRECFNAEYYGLDCRCVNENCQWQ